MKIVLCLLLSYVVMFIILMALLFAIDLEVARRDYNKIISGKSEDAQVEWCVFAYSCNKYNDLLIGHFHW